MEAGPGAGRCHGHCPSRGSLPRSRADRQVLTTGQGTTDCSSSQDIYLPQCRVPLLGSFNTSPHCGLRNPTHRSTHWLFLSLGGADAEEATRAEGGGRRPGGRSTPCWARRRACPGRLLTALGPCPHVCLGKGRPPAPVQRGSPPPPPPRGECLVPQTPRLVVGFAL